MQLSQQPEGVTREMTEFHVEVQKYEFYSEVRFRVITITLINVLPSLLFCLQCSSGTRCAIENGCWRLLRVASCSECSSAVSYFHIFLIGTAERRRTVCRWHCALWLALGSRSQMTIGSSVLFDSWSLSATAAKERRTL